MRAATTADSKPHHISQDSPPTREAIRDFRERLDAMLAGPDRTEAALDLLLDFFNSRCHEVGELKSLGEALFAALGSSAPRVVVSGRYDDRFLFDRKGDSAWVYADGMMVASLHLDEAMRLATLLHGAAQTSHTRHAA